MLKRICPLKKKKKRHRLDLVYLHTKTSERESPVALQICDFSRSATFLFCWKKSVWKLENSSVKHWKAPETYSCLQVHRFQPATGCNIIVLHIDIQYPYPESETPLETHCYCEISLFRMLTSNTLASQNQRHPETHSYCEISLFCLLISYALASQNQRHRVILTLIARYHCFASWYPIPLPVRIKDTEWYSLLLRDITVLLVDIQYPCHSESKTPSDTHCYWEISLFCLLISNTPASQNQRHRMILTVIARCSLAHQNAKLCVSVNASPITEVLTPLATSTRQWHFYNEVDKDTNVQNTVSNSKAVIVFFGLRTTHQLGDSEQKHRKTLTSYACMVPCRKLSTPQSCAPFRLVGTGN